MLPQDQPPNPSEKSDIGATSFPFSENTTEDSYHEVARGLLILLHLQNCGQESDGSDELPPSRCPFDQGELLKEWKYRFTECQSIDCQAIRSSTTLLFKHWILCKSQDCFICSSVMNIIIKQFVENAAITNRTTDLKSFDGLKAMGITRWKKVVTNYFRRCSCNFCVTTCKSIGILSESASTATTAATP